MEAELPRGLIKLQKKGNMYGSHRRDNGAIPCSQNSRLKEDYVAYSSSTVPVDTKAQLKKSRAEILEKARESAVGGSVASTTLLYSGFKKHGGGLCTRLRNPGWA